FERIREHYEANIVPGQTDSPSVKMPPLVWFSATATSLHQRVGLVRPTALQGSEGARRASPPSLRGAKRRSNPAFFDAAKLDCFASPAMTPAQYGYAAAFRRPALP